MKRSRRPNRSSDKVVSVQSLPRKTDDAAADANQSRRRGGVVVLAVGVLLLVCVALFTLPVFRVNEINVSGAEQVDESGIIENSGLETGRHLFQGWGGSVSTWLGLRYESAEENIASEFPYIRTVRVRMGFPSKINITVTERVPGAYLALEDDANILLDTEGYVLEIEEGEVPEGIPLIEGVTILAARVGSRISTASIQSVETALSFIDAVMRSDRAASDNFVMLEHVLDIRVPGGDSAYLKVKLTDSPTPIHVKLGEVRTFDDALNWLRYTIRTNRLDDLGPGVLDLSGDNYIFIRDIEEER